MASPAAIKNEGPSDCKLALLILLVVVISWNGLAIIVGTPICDSVSSARSGRAAVPPPRIR